MTVFFQLEMSCEHEHHHHEGPEIATFSSQSLHGSIDTSRARALNLANPAEDLPFLFKSPTERYSTMPVFKSDADNELIIHIPFTCPVKIYSIVLRTASQDDHYPKTMHIYKNRLDTDFSDLQSFKPDHTFEHPRGVGLDAETREETVQGDVGFVECHLPRRKFTGVGGISLYLSENWVSDDPVVLFSIEVRGESSGLKNAPVIALYEAAPQPKGSLIEDKMNAIV